MEQLLLESREQLRAQVGGLGIGVLKDRVDEGTESGTDREVGHRRGQVGECDLAGRRDDDAVRSRIDTVRLVLARCELGLALHTWTLGWGAGRGTVTWCRQGGVGGSCPRPVDGAGPVSDAEIGHAVVGGEPDGRARISPLQDQSSLIGPRREPNRCVVVALAAEGVRHLTDPGSSTEGESVQRGVRDRRVG